MTIQMNQFGQTPTIQLQQTAGQPQESRAVSTRDSACHPQQKQKQTADRLVQQQAQAQQEQF